MARKSFAAYLVGLAAIATLLAADVPPAHTPFVTVLLRNFDSWDTNHDGVLSSEEINKAVTDPSVKGDDAAAAASIKLLMRSKKTKLPPLTREFFNEYDRQAKALMARHSTTADHAADAVNATVDTVASASTTQPAARSARLPADFDLYFTAGQARISRGGPDSYPGRFDLDHTRQGPLGDCFLVSSASSFAFHDPDRFKKLIVPLKSGGYEVHLPATHPIFVPQPTDAELAISSTTAGDGIWMAIIEQAYGKLRSRIRGNTDDVEGTELIRTGGDSMPTIKALTGHPCTRISFGKTVEFRQLHAQQILTRLRQQLVSALADHRVITAGIAARHTESTTKPVESGTPVPIPPDISTNHVYVVVSYDPTTDIVEIWNPHGQHFQPKGPPSIKNGYPTEHGRFKLPLTEAYQFYSSFTFEQSSPGLAE